MELRAGIKLTDYMNLRWGTAHVVGDEIALSPLIAVGPQD